MDREGGGLVNRLDVGEDGVLALIFAGGCNDLLMSAGLRSSPCLGFSAESGNIWLSSIILVNPSIVRLSSFALLVLGVVPAMAGIGVTRRFAFPASDKLKLGSSPRL